MGTLTSIKYIQKGSRNIIYGVLVLTNADVRSVIGIFFLFFFFCHYICSDSLAGCHIEQFTRYMRKHTHHVGTKTQSLVKF